MRHPDNQKRGQNFVNVRTRVIAVEMATIRSCSDLAFGKNVVTDFSHGDNLELDGVFQNFQAVQAASHQAGATHHQ